MQTPPPLTTFEVQSLWIGWLTVGVGVLVALGTLIGFIVRRRAKLNSGATPHPQPLTANDIEWTGPSLTDVLEQSMRNDPAVKWVASPSTTMRKTIRNAGDRPAFEVTVEGTAEDDVKRMRNQSITADEVQPGGRIDFTFISAWGLGGPGSVLVTWSIAPNLTERLTQTVTID